MRVRGQKVATLGSKKGQGRPIYVGLTGSLASGKSTVLQEFKRLGWATLSADAVVKKIYRQKGLTKTKLIKKYGLDIRGLKKLEAWIHPLAKQEIKKFLQNKCLAIVEVPLLFEARMQGLFDKIIFVSAASGQRYSRAVKRGMNPDRFTQLSRRQWSDKRKKSLSDSIILNRGSIRELKLKVQKVERVLRRTLSSKATL